MPKWSTFADVVRDLNALLKEYDMAGIEDIATYRHPLLARIEKVVDREAAFPGAGYVPRIQTAAPKNAQVRLEDDDVPLPGKHAYEKMNVPVVEYMASTGVTKREMEELIKRPTAVADIVDEKLEDLKNDIRLRISLAMRGDGTGRLARIDNAGTISGSGTPAAPWVCPVGGATTVYNWGWRATQVLEPGLRVDVYTIPDNAYTTACTLKRKNLVVAAVSDTNVSLYADGNSSGNGTIALNDTIFLTNTVNISPSDSYLLGFNEMMGIWGIVDAATSANSVRGSVAIGAAGGVRRGAGAGPRFQGLSSRGLYSQLNSRTVSNFSGTNPASWTLETILSQVRAIDYGKGGGQVTAIYASPNTVAAIARKAALGSDGGMNAYTPVTDGKITGGWYTDAIRSSTGRIIPLIPCIEIPDGTVFGGDENDLVFFQPVPVGFETYGRKGPFFPSPGRRDLTFEAWMRFVGNLVARRTDNWFVIEGLQV